MPELPRGFVYFVGAGPGDPGLLTLRGRDCLARADLVLYDYLVDERLLQFAKTDAERLCLGRHGQGRLLSIEEIVQTVVAAAKRGRVVCRLKSGDPTIFARASEEIQPLQQHGVPYEVVPGVTAAIACGAYAGVPLTDRDSASAVAFITARTAEMDGGRALDYAELARFPGTLVFYMGVTAVGQWTEGLMRGGCNPGTPVMLVRRCSFADQQSWTTTLSEAAQLIARERLRPPVIAIVGDVVNHRASSNWFTNRPLFGASILIARPEEQAHALAVRLEELGARVFSLPAIEISPPKTWSELDAAIGRLDSFQWIVFMSANGVRYFFTRLRQLGRDARSLGGLRIAAIGAGTVRALQDWQLSADLIPAESRAESLAESLVKAAQGAKVLAIRASRGREVLADTLRNAGIPIEQAVAYHSSDVEAADPQVLSAIDQGMITCAVVTSSAIARSLAALLGPRIKGLPLVSISPVTSATLRELGLEPEVESTRYDMTGVIDSIMRRWGK